MRGWLSIMTVSLLVSPAAGAESKIESQWPAWRGPNLNGLVDGGNPPVEWSETKNIKWKTAIPGVGNSSPVVSGRRVYLTAGYPIEEGTRRPGYWRVVLALIREAARSSGNPSSTTRHRRRTFSIGSTP